MARRRNGCRTGRFGRCIRAARYAVGIRTERYTLASAQEVLERGIIHKDFDRTDRRKLERGLRELRLDARIVTLTPQFELPGQFDGRFAVRDSRALKSQVRPVEGIVKTRLAILPLVERKQFIQRGLEGSIRGRNNPVDSYGAVAASDRRAGLAVIFQGDQEYLDLSE